MNAYFTVLFHVKGEGCSCTFENGSAAMSLAMDLERQDYVVTVFKYGSSDPMAEETIYQSDDWIPVAEAMEQHES